MTTEPSRPGQVRAGSSTSGRERRHTCSGACGIRQLAWRDPRGAPVRHVVRAVRSRAVLGMVDVEHPPGEYLGTDGPCRGWPRYPCAAADRHLTFDQRGRQRAYATTLANLIEARDRLLRMSRADDTRRADAAEAMRELSARAAPVNFETRMIAPAAVEAAIADAELRLTSTTTTPARSRPSLSSTFVTLSAPSGSRCEPISASTSRSWPQPSGCRGYRQEAIEVVSASVGGLIDS
jgi:hypothetical protein